MPRTVRIARAAYYNLFIDTYERAGAPVENWMEDASLPLSMRGDPDCYIASLSFLNFIKTADVQIGLPDLSGDAIRSMKLKDFATPTQAGITQAANLLSALRAFITHSKMESNEQHYWFDLSHPAFAWICSETPLSKNSYLPNLLQNWAVIVILRAYLGPKWTPPEIAFQSQLPPGENFRKDVDGSNILHDQPVAWVSVPKSCLIRRLPGMSETPLPATLGEVQAAPILVPAAVREILKPRIRSGIPVQLPGVAEALLLSSRSLQRLLGASGTTFRSILNEARVDVAREMLEDQETRVIDVAMSLGYSDSSHFSRSFREQTGLTPTEYQQSL